jgi:Zn-dependent M28 family amino/carboxypeptidase
VTLQSGTTWWLVAVVAWALGSALPAWAGDAACAARSNNTTRKLLECVTLHGVSAHQLELQEIADANGGDRFAASQGYFDSVDYVAGRLAAAGYAVTVQPFEYLTFFRTGPSSLQQLAPAAVSYVENTDFVVFEYSAPGDVSAAVTAVDLQLGLGNASTSGCEAADFAGFPAGHIALVQRGSCSFQVKAENAAAAGAVGAIVFNQGNSADPERTALYSGTLSAAYAGGIPVVSASYDRGVEWAGTAGLALRMHANTFSGAATSYNVLAETQGGDPANVVMVGAHLDSVDGGPGINDNGSGSAAILETALQMAKVNPRNKLRFAWWGAEESGLVGSDHYVSNLSAAERSQIALYLNFDMIGSPNFVRFVYDGDGSAFGLPGPAGSDAIEAFFADFYAARGLLSEETQISFRSDYAAFFDFGIPFGGLFSGAEGIKTAQQAADYGGVAGVAYDPCYHRACDTYDNASDEALDVNADAVAAATLHFAMNTSAVNGVEGKGNFRKPRPADLETLGGRYAR